MKEINFSTSACRYCRFYMSEGRRGGSCQMLNVPVKSSWKACAFASPPFVTTIEKLEDIFHLETAPKKETRCNTSVRKTNLTIAKPDLEEDFQLPVARQKE